MKNIIQKLTTPEGDRGNEAKKRKKNKKGDRPFDHGLYKKRHVLFRVAYFGWDYHGFAVQDNTGTAPSISVYSVYFVSNGTREIHAASSKSIFFASNFNLTFNILMNFLNGKVSYWKVFCAKLRRSSPALTIEAELFRALVTTRLIQSRETSNYHRCGRTDRGVSAAHQVISIDVRSNVRGQAKGVFEYDGCRAHERPAGKNVDEQEEEIDYCRVLNANLPSHIQVLAWAPCSSTDVSAR